MKNLNEIRVPETQKSQHTPTAWKLDVVEDKRGREYFAINGKHLALLTSHPYEQDTWNEDDLIEAVQTIVRAVNCHEELLASLKSLSIHMRGKCEHETIDECNDEMGQIVSDAIAKVEQRSVGSPTEG